jgi:hypothetical protein
MNSQKKGICFAQPALHQITSSATVTNPNIESRHPATPSENVISQAKFHHNQPLTSTNSSVQRTINTYYSDKSRVENEYRKENVHVSNLIRDIQKNQYDNSILYNLQTGDHHEQNRQAADSIHKSSNSEPPSNAQADFINFDAAPGLTDFVSAAEPNNSKTENTYIDILDQLFSPNSDIIHKTSYTHKKEFQREPSNKVSAECSFAEARTTTHSQYVQTHSGKDKHKGSQNLAREFSAPALNTDVWGEERRQIVRTDNIHTNNKIKTAVAVGDKSKNNNLQVNSKIIKFITPSNSNSDFIEKYFSVNKDQNNNYMNGPCKSANLKEKEKEKMKMNAPVNPNATKHKASNLHNKYSMALNYEQQSKINTLRIMQTKQMNMLKNRQRQTNKK